MSEREHGRDAGHGSGGRAGRSPTPASRDPRPGTSIRVAAPDDLDTVLALRLALLHEHRASPLYGRLRADAPQRARRLFAAQLASAVEVTFLAEREVPTRAPEVVGILRCMEGRGAPLLDPDRYGYVASVYVVPALRRQGTLHLLFEAAIAWCRDRGLDELRLHTAADNATANDAWRAFGFTVVEHLHTLRLGAPG